MTEIRTCRYEPCSKEFTPTHPRQEFCEPTCRANQHYVDHPEKGRVLQGGALRSVATQPLAEVRARQATKKHNRDLGGLIRQAIVDRIKTTGECFADDLVELYPEGEVKECRRLATAQFGSMVSAGLIREKERRKSSIPARKGAKSGVYVFTDVGREQLGRVGNSSGGSTPSSDAAAVSGEAGLTGPGSGAGESASPLDAPDGPHGRRPSASTASPDKSPTGVSAGRPTSQGDGRFGQDQKPAGVHSGEGSEPVPLPGFEESAAAQHMKDAA